MAFDIGSNFSYQGKGFIDKRVDWAESEKDLLDWNIPVPEGFEVCVSGVWYVYSESYNSPVTGKFLPRVTDNVESAVPGQSASAVAIKNMSVGMGAELLELQEAVFPLSFSSFSAGTTTFEIGSSTTPKITWEISRKGQPATPTRATVNGSTSGVASSFKSWTSPSSISGNTTYTVKVESGRLSVSKGATYSFYYKKYWGVSSKTSLTNADILAFSSTWATGKSMSQVTFNCTGGKYPYYVVPAEYAGAEWWIGGLKNTNIVSTTLNLTNASGAKHDYIIYRLANLQTGSLSIEFK